MYLGHMYRLDLLQQQTTYRCSTISLCWGRYDL